MESLLGPRSLGEESLQMWDLNKRLEAYLARVKYLEEENELLKVEVQGLRATPQERQPWRSRYEGEVAALRAALGQAFLEQGTAELARESLYAEVQRVKSQCQKERSAREEARRLLSLGRKELEEEERAQVWLREKAAQLEKEREAQVQGHHQDLAALDQEVAAAAAAAASWGLGSFRAALAPAGSSPQAEVEDYAQRLSGLWKGAVETYQAEVCQLEASLRQAKEHLWKATEGHRLSQQQLQQLENQLSGLRLQKEMLEESLAHDWQQQQGEAEKMQLAIESLEEEKRSLRVQIAQVLEDRQQLMHLKMSLSLEVATYRTLLETESSRLQLPATSFQLPSGLKESTFDGSHHRQLQGASLGRGYFGSRDFQPSPTSTPKGKPWSLKSHTEPWATNLASTFPKSGRMPVAREFQKANIALPPPPSKAFDEGLNPKGAPDLAEAAPAFPLGLSQQNKRVEATGRVSPSFFHDFPPGQNFLSHVNGEVSEEESASSTGGRSQEEGEGVDEVAQREAEGPDPEEEEEEEPKEEDASAAHGLPSPRQLLETFSLAAREVNGAKLCHEPNSSAASGRQKGSPGKDDEERRREAPSPSREGWEGAAQGGGPECQDGQPTDQPEEEEEEEVKGVEHTMEANGGQESYLEWAEEEEEEEEEGGRLWVSQEAEAASSLPRGFPKGERGREAMAATGVFVPPAAEREGETEARPSGQGGGPRTEEPLQVEQGEGPEGTHVPPAGPLGKDAERASWQPSSPSDPHRGALGGSLEEMEGRGEGEEEDVEVGGTEPSLHLSEEEEEGEEKERAPPKGEDEELQAGSGLGLDGGFALDQGSPTSHTTSAAASGQELLSWPEAAQGEGPEHSRPLCESDSALADAEEEERVLGAREETLKREGTPGARGEENTWAGEVRTEEEEGREEMPREKDVAEEENPTSSTEGEAKRQDFPLSHKGEDGLEKEEAMEEEEGGSGVSEQKEENRLESEEEAIEPEGFSEVEPVGDEELQEENTVGKEGTTGQDRRASDRESILPKETPPKEEDHLESEDTLEQDGFSDTEPVGHEDLLETEREMEAEDTTEWGGFSEVENIGRKDLQEKENEMENEDPIAMESFLATEDTGEQTPHREEARLGGIETAEGQEGFSGTEKVGPLGLHREVKGLEHEATTGEERWSGVETSKEKPPSQATDNAGDGETVGQGGPPGVQKVGAQDLPQEEDALGKGHAAEKTRPSEAERVGAQDLQAGEDPLAKEDTAGEEVSSNTGMASSQEEATCQPDVAFLWDENLLGQEPAEETSNLSEEQPWMEEEEGKEDTAGLPPVAESDVTGEDPDTGLDASAMGHEEATGTWEAGEGTGPPKGGEEDSPQGSSAATGSGTDPHVDKGQVKATGGGEEDFHSQDTTRPLQQAPVGSQEEPQAPPETHSSHVPRGPEGAGDGKERGSRELPRDASGSEESPGSSDASPNATGEMDDALGEEEGEEEEVRSREGLLLEETLPDSTPLYMYDEQVCGVSGTGQGSPKSQAAEVELPPSSQGLEEERLHSPPLRGNAQEQEATEEEDGGHAEVVPGPQELPQASAPLEEMDARKAGLPLESQDLHAATGLGGPRMEEGPGENPELLGAESGPQSFHTETSSVESSNKPTGPVHQEESGTDLATKGSVPQADLLEAPPRPEKSCHEEDGRPLELSGGSHAEGESDACQASPLTSVAELGEIILEGDAAESRDFEASREEGLPDAQEPPPFPQPGGRGREEGVLGTHPGSKDLLEGPTAAESMKEADILEIVAQALEFNQELIKAAEERAEAELLSAAAGGETVGPPEGRSPSSSAPFSEVKESQVSEEAQNVSSPSSSSSSQDPTESNPLWVANDPNGVQLDPSLSDATKALELNGIGGLPPSGREYEGSSFPFAEELVQKVALTHQEREGLSTGAGMPAGKVISLFPEERFLDPKGPEEEAAERKESQTDGVKGRKEAEAIPGLPHVEVEMIPGQLLKFQTGEGGLWAQEGN